MILHYDRAQQVLGVQPVKGDDEDGAIKVSIKSTPNKDGRGTAISAFISAKSFLNYYRIPYDDTKSFEAKWDSQLGMLIAFLADQPTKNEPAASG